MAKRKPVKPRVPRTHGGGTLTESQFWGKIRSALRREFRYWPPVKGCIKLSYVPGKGYQCESCKQLFRTQKEMAADHIIPCGSLKCWEDLVPFVQRLCPEGEVGEHGQALCKPCHQEKTNQERRERNKK